MQSLSFPAPAAQENTLEGEMDAKGPSAHPAHSLLTWPSISQPLGCIRSEIALPRFLLLSPCSLSTYRNQETSQVKVETLLHLWVNVLCLVRPVLSLSHRCVVTATRMHLINVQCCAMKCIIITMFAWRPCFPASHRLLQPVTECNRDTKAACLFLGDMGLL